MDPAGDADGTGVPAARNSTGRPSRRQLLASAGALGATLVAGCTGTGGGGGDGGDGGSGGGDGGMAGAW
ncbi:MAG: hypothetical protein ABEJ05_10425 [Haloglomus sp.]